MRNTRFNQIEILFGMIVILVGTAVMVGWFFSMPTVIQIFPIFKPMQFNSALCFFLAGVSVLALNRDFKKVATVCTSGISALCALTFLEYLTGLDFGIDQFFLKSPSAIYFSHPGRMSSNTSLCFVMVGIALGLLSLKKSKRTELICVFLGVAVIGFSTLAIMTMVMPVADEYGWGNFASMALLTAVNFILLGIEITLRALRLLYRKRPDWVTTLPVLVSSVLLVGVIGFWQAALRHQTNEIERVTTTEAESIRSQINQGLLDRIQSIERMANRYEVMANLPKEAWLADAEMYYKHLNVLNGMGVITADYRLRWGYPENETQKFIGFDFSVDPVRKMNLDLARETSAPTVTPVVELKQGGRGFIVFVPMFRQGKSIGWISAGIKPEIFVNRVLKVNGYEFSLISGTETIFSNIDQTKNLSRQWGVTIDGDLYSHPIKIKVVPLLETIRANESEIPYIILVTGVFISLLLGIMLHLGIMSRKQSKIIGEQKNYLDTIIDSSPLAILVLDRERKLTLWNPACERIFGWRRDEVLGGELPFLPPEFRLESADLMEQIFASSSEVQAEAIRCRRDGIRINVHIAAKVLINEHKEVYGLMAVLDDITERKNAHAELLSARHTAEKATLVKSEFLANMSHEIRTPLNGIIGMSDLLLDTHLEGDQKRYAHIIQNSGTALLTLINDILDFSKIEAGKIQLENLDFSLTSLVESQIDLLVSKAREKNLALMTYLSPQLPQTVRGDPGRIGQILINLIGNAIKFSHEGGVTVSVTETAPLQTLGRFRVRVEVKDTGIGMNKAAQSKLFLPFSQVDGSTARKYGGTGLGLSISKSIVERMNGQIGIESVEGVGSTFWFEVELNAIEKSEGNFLKKRILVVDDDRITIESIQRYVGAWGMDGDCTTSFNEGSEKLAASIREGKPYDIVLIGKGLRSETGLRWGESMKEKWGEKCPHLVLMIEFDTVLKEIRYEKNAFVDVLNKPVKQSQLYDALIQAEHREELVQPVSADSTVQPLSTARILVADDVAANQMLTVKFLEKLGYSAQAVANGKEAISALHTGQFDLILMDCQMPEMDGYQATRAIRKLNHAQFNSIPIVALTANAMSGDEHLCLAAGMNDYLAKPFKRERLGEIVEKWLPLGKKQSA
jgi:PAS domain S-box-containing protein